MSERILVVEDEEKISRLLELELGYEGYYVQKADTGRKGLDLALEQSWDLILLDIMLPELSGTEVLRRLRKTDSFTPVIFLTAKDTVPDKVSGLDQGANDYITKPFDMEELLARIRACIRNRQTMNEGIKENVYPSVMRNGALMVNTLTREVECEGEKIELTPKEFDLLIFLMKNKNIVLNREQIINHVWGFNFIGETNVVDVYIRYLRKKIDYVFNTQYIQTIRGVGYCIRENDQ
ncbi:response regulator transcription factor [Aneurinibacillus sp. Ricciae_BoGa-3]|uniref:response regulator transcription factor n=1 Tax=Aneurinibacillus sp. Ricciae_BoGa-3 TaxID=3022697 RepID=UPI00233F8F6E|nr:response regulator transcription factor [Aneurinibacillus sp. Ricciae_BoGa-3]WCK52555.1 response regulator transcription factor [Aneurinibacillus sp. Ricciae_BoGa-3]